MSAQLSLLEMVATDTRAAATAAARAPREIKPIISSRDAVVACGAGAPEVPVHRVLPEVAGVSRETAAAMLRLAEDAVRYNAAPRARIDDRLSARNGAGQNGPIGGGTVMSEGKDVKQLYTGERIPWTRLLAALAHAREMEPEVARVRDLAEARRYLHYYARAYDRPLFNREPGPPAGLLEGIREEIAALGGDPDEPVAQAPKAAA